MACATLKRSLESVTQIPSKRRRCAPFTPSNSPGIRVLENRVSIFGDADLSNHKLTPEQIQELRNESKRLQRRRQLKLATGATYSSSSGSEGDCSPPHHSLQQIDQKALFTFKQVRMICEKMLREQEASLRAEYEAALSAKLAEQYEAFVRFNLDQVQRRPPPTLTCHGSMEADSHMQQDFTPSYLS